MTLAQLSIPALNGIGAVGIVVAAVTAVGAIILGCVATYQKVDGYEVPDGLVRKLALSAGAATVVASLAIGLAVWALSTASLRTDTNIPNRLDRKQIDVNVDSSTPTGVIVGGG